MSRTAVFHGYVRDGQKHYSEPGRELKWCIQNEGKRFREERELETATRSDNLNRYYWKVVIKEHVCELLEAFLGEPVSKDDAHSWCKVKFLPNNKTLDGAVVPGSTTELSSAEFMDYCAAIRHFWFHKCGAHIPEPNEREVAA